MKTQLREISKKKNLPEQTQHNGKMIPSDIETLQTTAAILFLNWISEQAILLHVAKYAAKWVLGGFLFTFDRKKNFGRSSRACV